MSKSQNFQIALLTILMALAPAITHAAKMRGGGGGYSSASSEGNGSSSRGARQEMMVDLSAHYVRDTRPDGSNDTAGRLSLGGMFNNWLGLDVQGLYEVKSKSYLIGTDLRIAPVEWLFLKGGVGGYADKNTRSFKLTPLAGAGILARFLPEYYFVTEASFFQVSERNNISFGVGVGLVF